MPPFFYSIIIYCFLCFKTIGTYHFKKQRKYCAVLLFPYDGHGMRFPFYNDMIELRRIYRCLCMLVNQNLDE